MKRPTNNDPESALIGDNTINKGAIGDQRSDSKENGMINKVTRNNQVSASIGDGKTTQEEFMIKNRIQ